MMLLLLAFPLLPGAVAGPPAPRPAPPPPAATPAEAALVPATQLAQQLQDAAGAGEAARLQQAVDVDALADTVARDYPAATAARGALRTQLAAAFDWGPAVCQAVQRGGTYRLVQVRLVDGQPRALFRLATPQGLNYHDLALRGTGKDLRIVDIYLHAEGEWITATWRRQFVQALARRPAVEGLTLHADDAVYLASLARLTKLQQQSQDGHYADALAIAVALPPALQATKWVLAARLHAALRLPGGQGAAATAAVTEATQAFTAAFPADPALDFMLLAAAREQGQWDAALAALDRLAPVVAQDPFLDVVRGTIALQREQTAAAHALGEQAVQALPDLPEPHLLLIAASLKLQDDDEIARQLTAAERQVGMRFAGLEQQPAFAAFVKSSAYRQWLATQTKKKK